MAAVSKLKAHEVPFSIISVITPATLSCMDEVIDFFAELGVRVGFNVEEAEGVNFKSSLYANDQRLPIKTFYQKLLARQERRPGWTIRELEKMSAHLSAPPDSVTERSTNTVGSILSFDVDGNVSTFSPELLAWTHERYGRFTWANVHRHAWDDLLQNRDFQRVRDDIKAGIDSCARSCGYYAVCGGGEPSNKLAELGTFAATETEYCRLHLQALADVVIEESERKFSCLK
jgi:uncharacterized protein